MLMKKILYALALIAIISSVLLGVHYTKNVKLRDEVTMSLSKVHELEMAYKAMFGHYTDNIYAIAYIQDTLVTEGGNANYLVTLERATDSTFKATAISVIDFDGDGQFSQWQVDETGNIIEIVED